MVRITGLEVVLGLDLTRFQKQLDRSLGRLKAVGAQMRQVGSTLSTRLTLPIAALGAASARSFAIFQKEMNNVRALSGATGEQFAQLTDLARELGRTTQFSASQAASAQSFLAKAGLETEEIISALPRTLELAAAANIDLASAADIVTNVVSGMRIPMSDLAKANDILAKAATSSNTDIAQLGQAFKFVGPVAASAGIEFEEVTAILGQLGNVGIQASMAGTALRGTITKLLNPSAEAQKILDRLGITVLDTSGKMRPLVEIIGDLERAGISTGEIMEVFGQRAGPAMAALIQTGSAELGNFIGKLEDAGGTAKRLADVQIQGLFGAWVKMRSALEGAAIAIGEKLEPALTKLAEFVTRASAAIAEMDASTLTAIISVAGLAAAIGPLLVGLGLATQGLNLLAVAALRAATFMLPLLITIGAIALKVALVLLALLPFIAALGLLALAAILVVKNFDQLILGLQIAAEEWAKGVRSLFIMAKRWLIDKMGALWEVFTGFFTTILNRVRAFAAGVVSFFEVIFVGARNWIVEKVGGALEAMADFFAPVLRRVSEFVDNIITFWVDVYKGAKHWLVLQLERVANLMIGIFNNISEIVGLTIDQIKIAASEFGDEFKRQVSDVKDDFVSGFAGIKAQVLGDVEDIVGGVNTEFQGLDTTLNVDTSLAQVALGGLRTVLESMGFDLDATNAKLSELTGNLNNVGTSAGTSAEQVGTAMDSATESMTFFSEFSSTVISSFSTNFADAITGVITDAENLGENLTDVFQNLRSIIISTLIRMGVQRALTAATSAAASQTQTSAEVSGAAARTFAGQFAAMSAAPFPVNLTAPAVAASMLAQMRVGAAAARATAFAEGGLVRAPTLGIVGEAGPELITPLNRVRDMFQPSRQEIVIMLDGEEIGRAAAENLPEFLAVNLGTNIT